MKFKSLLYAAALAATTLFGACDDDISDIGSSLSDGTLRIFADTLDLEVPSQSIETSAFDARTATHLIGRLSSDQYGDLSCAFLSQMMAASTMTIPDSIDVSRVDSVKLIFAMPRGQFLGDSLAPQQLAVYRLTKQIPSDIKSNFDPTDYYSSSSLLGTKTYTLSQLSITDTVVTRRNDIRLGIDLPLSFGRDIFTAYREHPETFAWPSTFNQFFPGIYVTRTFGSGCVANARKVEMMLYYHYLVDKSVTEDGKTFLRQIHERDSVALFATAPEVLSSNKIAYTPSASIKNRVADGETIIASPCGYNAHIVFPVSTIVNKFTDTDKSLAIVSNLNFTLPTSQISNNLGINPPPYLLMVKSSEVDDFFAENRVPDNATSFYAKYDTSSNEYSFSNMREYILPFIENGNLNEDDTDFMLIPVDISEESYTSGGKTYTIVTSCTPYMKKPSMVRLNTSAARIVFTYSLQQLR